MTSRPAEPYKTTLYDTISIPNYFIARLDRNTHGGGVALYIYLCIQNIHTEPGFN